MKAKSSLGGRLLAAFLVIAGLPAISGLIGWIELRGVARTQTRVVTESIPAVGEVRGFAEESSRVVAVAPELAAVRTDADRVTRATYLYKQVDALSARLQRYIGAGGEAPEGLVRTVTDMRGAIASLDDLAARRNRALVKQDRLLRDGLTATEELLDIADTLVANAEMGTSAVISNLYEIEDGIMGAEARLDTLDKLIEVDLFQLGLMFQEGRGAPQNFHQAAALFSRAAEQGHALAQYNLACLYQRYRQEARRTPRAAASALPGSR